MSLENSGNGFGPRKASGALGREHLRTASP
jgi:hypothetical protein